MIKESVKYTIDRTCIKVDDVVDFRQKGTKEFQRAIVSYVDKDSIKLVRRYHDQISISATSIGRGLYEIKKLTVS
ncbi:hypothetical protein [Enterococcus durans]|uniref:hypothetical protein n=1 Tax=Enterococcus durans TaxID=53345 RepID=UPI0011931885|nr:hypothetical protein [Enterococcus durans]MBC9707351.1 hypothetical protein [Enterococcus sp.]CAJ1888805.1 hypothetical protein AUSP0058_00019 [uncultured phage]HAQ4516692.1 hypothetical protein [Enterococcus faecium]MCB8505782.1 hypothetical protein [Enterococcus durans]MCB8515675.1 hypothetical protein [Enterococcus durans]